MDPIFCELAGNFWNAGEQDTERRRYSSLIGGKNKVDETSINHGYCTY
jgi:hypothetical protein